MRCSIAFHEHFQGIALLGVHLVDLAEELDQYFWTTKGKHSPRPAPWRALQSPPENPAQC